MWARDSRVRILDCKGCQHSAKVTGQEVNGELTLRPSLQMASQSSRDWGEAAGEVSSMYSTPKSERAVAL